MEDTGRNAIKEEQTSEARRNSLELLAEIALASSPSHSSSSHTNASLKRRATNSHLEVKQPPVAKFKPNPESESATSIEDSEETAISSISSPNSLSSELASLGRGGENRAPINSLEDGVDRISQMKESYFAQNEDRSSMAADYVSRQELLCLGLLASPTASDLSLSSQTITRTSPSKLLSVDPTALRLQEQLTPPHAKIPATPSEVEQLQKLDPSLQIPIDGCNEHQDTVSSMRNHRNTSRPKAKPPKVRKAKGLASSGRVATSNRRSRAPGNPSPGSDASSMVINNPPENSFNTMFVQERRCITITTKHNKCVACNKRKKGDTCRFLGIRAFPGGTSTEPVGEPFLVSDDRSPGEVHYPTSWNTKMSDDAMLRVKRVVARSLLGILEEEMRHLAKVGVVVRNRELEFRVTCDCCMTSIFTSCWICQDCGREYCEDCHAQVAHVTENLSGPEFKARRRSPLKVLSEAEGKTKRLMICSFNNEHSVSRFVPVSRFRKEELQGLIEDMKKVTADEGQEDSVPIPPVDMDSTPSCTAHIAPTDPDDPSGVGSHPLHTFSSDTFDESAFRPLWAKGQALVVTGLLDKFKLSWTPEMFIREYGSQECEVVECRTNEVQSSMVGSFFEKFGKFESREGCLKLKDWPPMAEFSKEFPSLFQDFARAVPVPNYTRRDGILNIAAYFPTNPEAIIPDIGPKMYNAFKSSELPGGNGSTRLHMDMADAVNIMMFASARNGGSAPGVAVWDIYQAKDSQVLREFLGKKFGTSVTDPIHSQEHYLDSELRKELWEVHGVKSWRIYQKPGEAVFIPAGCAHQVCNLSDCIKIAVDFVSPENVDRCEILTNEFREQNQSLAWKEDVLQLKMMMYHAWKSLSQLPRVTHMQEDLIMAEAC